MSSPSSESEPEMEAAVLSRSRRSTAGKRMSFLVGKAQEDDEAFWSHSTWKEDTEKKGDGEVDDVSSDGSYNVHDEDEENVGDVFDSDFNDSEDDDDDDDDDGEATVEEVPDENDEKKTNRYVEPKSKAVSKRHAQIVAAGRELLKRKKGSKKGSSRRKVGEGTEENTGLILNVQPTLIGDDGNRIPICPFIYTQKKKTEPSEGIDQQSEPLKQESTPQQDTTSSSILPSRPISVQTPTPKPAPAPAPAPSTAPRNQPKRSSSISPPTNTSTEKRPESRHSSSSSKKEKSNGKSNGSNNNSKQQKQKRKYTQEELLMEAAHTTEAENERWLLERKRLQTLTEDKLTQSRLMMKLANAEKNLYQRFHSRRGCFNTITFTDMDRVPQILKNRQVVKYIPVEENICIITGKQGRYKDPKTGERYYDSEAFKELRRRLENGEPLDQRDEVKTSLSETEKINKSSSVRNGKIKSTHSNAKKHESSSSISTKDVKKISVDVEGVHNGKNIKENEDVKDSKDAKDTMDAKIPFPSNKQSKIIHEKVSSKKLDNSTALSDKKPSVSSRVSTRHSSRKDTATIQEPLPISDTKHSKAFNSNPSGKRKDAPDTSSTRSSKKNKKNTTVIETTNTSLSVPTTKESKTRKARKLSADLKLNEQEIASKEPTLEPSTKDIFSNKKTAEKVVQSNQMKKMTPLVSTENNQTNKSKPVAYEKGLQDATVSRRKRIREENVKVTEETSSYNKNTSLSPSIPSSMKSGLKEKKTNTKNPISKVKESSKSEPPVQPQLQPLPTSQLQPKSQSKPQPQLQPNMILPNNVTKGKLPAQPTSFIPKVPKQTEVIQTNAANVKTNEPLKNSKFAETTSTFQPQHFPYPFTQSHFKGPIPILKTVPEAKARPAISTQSHAEKSTSLNHLLPNHAKSEIQLPKEKKSPARNKTTKQHHLPKTTQTQTSNMKQSEVITIDSDSSSTSNIRFPLKQNLAAISKLGNKTQANESSPSTKKLKSPRANKKNQLKDSTKEPGNMHQHPHHHFLALQEQQELQNLMYGTQLQQFSSLSPFLRSQHLMFGNNATNPNLIQRPDTPISPLLLALQNSSLTAPDTPPTQGISLEQNALLSPKNSLLSQQEALLQQREELLHAQQQLLQQGLQQNQQNQPHWQQLLLQQQQYHDILLQQQLQLHPNEQQQAFLENQIHQQALFHLQQQQQHQQHQSLLHRQLQRQHQQAMLEQHMQQQQQLLALQQHQQRRLQRIENSFANENLPASFLNGNLDQFADAEDDDKKMNRSKGRK